MRRALYIPVRLLLLSLVFASVVGCKWTRKPSKPPGELPPVVAVNPAAQASYDAALALLEAGDYENARQAFILVQSEHSGDPIAAMAELYAARALMQDVGFSEQTTIVSSASSTDLATAASALDSLADARVDERVRWAATIYSAIASAASGDQARAVAKLARYPGASLGRSILQVDQSVAWLILLEGMWSAARFEDAFIASATLHALVAPRDDGQVISPRAARTNAVLMSHTRARGFEAATNHIDVRDLQVNFLPTESAFLHGIAGWALIQRSADERHNDNSRAELEDIYQRAAPALVSIGALERVGEMTMLMGTLGGEQRLFVGAVLPLSGKNKAVGLRAMRGLLLAQGALDTPDKPRLTLVFRDSQVDVKENVRFFQDLGVLAIVGPIERDLAAAYSQAAEDSHIPVVLLTAKALARPADTEAKGWVFRNFLDANSEAVAVAQASFDQLEDRRVALVYPNVGYGKSTAAAFRAAFEGRGGVIAAEVEYPRDDTDFSRTARKIARAKPDAIFIPDTGAKVAEIVAFLARENVWGIPGNQKPADKGRIQVHYLGTSLWQDTFLTRQAGGFIQGATIPAWYAPGRTDEQTRSFTLAYKAAYGTQPSLYEAFAYDTMVWLRDAILDAGLRRPSSVRDAIASPTPHVGVTGSARFLPWGEPDRVLGFITVKHDSFAPLELTQKVWANQLGSPRPAPAVAPTTSTEDAAPPKQLP